MTEVLLFSATWCAPCKAIAPQVEAIAKAEGVAYRKIDIVQEPSLAATYGVMSVPTLVVKRDSARMSIKGGGIVGALPGLIRTITIRELS